MESFYLAIDPGETTGWASFDETGKPSDYGQVKGRIPIYELLTEVQAKFLIVEDFELFPWKSKDQAFSKFEAVRIIGAIELWAYAKKAIVTLQKPNVKTVGYMWAGIPKSGSHKDSHWRDAYVHGIYYLQKEGIIKPQQFRKTT